MQSVSERQDGLWQTMRYGMARMLTALLDSTPGTVSEMPDDIWGVLAVLMMPLMHRNAPHTQVANEDDAGKDLETYFKAHAGWVLCELFGDRMAEFLDYILYREAALELQGQEPGRENPDDVWNAVARCLWDDAEFHGFFYRHILMPELKEGAFK